MEQDNQGSHSRHSLTRRRAVQAGIGGLALMAADARFGTAQSATPDDPGSMPVTGEAVAELDRRLARRRRER